LVSTLAWLVSVSFRVMVDFSCVAFISAFLSFQSVLIPSSRHAIICSVVCSIFVVWCCNYTVHSSVQSMPLVTLVIMCLSDYRWDLDWWIDLLTTYRL
jgi:hypothetical protein